MHKQVEQARRSTRKERAVGVTLLVAGFVIMGAAASQMGTGVVEAQMQQQSPAHVPSDIDKQGGQRPLTPAPEPSPPRNERGTTGSAPVSPQTGDRPPTVGTPLPQAPAEKTAPPVQGSDGRAAPK